MKVQSVRVALIYFTLSATTSSAQEVAANIREFVQAPNFPTSYRELTTSYDASVVPQLIELLNSTVEEKNFGRTAALLGAVGDERAVNALIAFVEKPIGSDRLSPAHEDAYREAITSLGLLVNRTGSERALRYLIDGLTPSVWRQRRVEGMAAWANSYDEYDRELSKYALFGLALSGHPDAGEALRSLQQSPTSAQQQFINTNRTTLTQWLQVHQLVADRGVAGMYDYYETERRAEEQENTEEAERMRAEQEQQRLRQIQER